MIDWIERARLELAVHQTGGTDETDKTRVSSVSSAPDERFGAQQPAPLPPLSSVSSVAAPRDVAPLASAPGVQLQDTRLSGNPYLTPDQGDECHAHGWSDAEISIFQARTRRFARFGRLDAEHLAERLTLRDRESDDRRLCLECHELEASGACAAARRGQLANADRHFEPTVHLLVRCPAFRGIDFHDR